MKLTVAILASLFTVSSFAQTLHCKTELSTAKTEDSFEFDNMKYRYQNFSQKIEKGSTFMNLIVISEDLNTSYNFAVSVENNKIVDISIENENSQTSSGIANIEMKKISFSSHDSSRGSGLELNCEVK